MPARFVNIDHDTPLLLPPDLRDWVPEDHLVHFIRDAVGLLDLSAARVNHSGRGREQFPPALMLALLIYSYATGTFSRRRIEKHTHEQVAVRLLCADHHPDHDTICEFRRGHRDLRASSFHQVLETAARLRVLLLARPPTSLFPSASSVGEVTLALDGTRILANASKHRAVSHGHASAQMQLLEAEIAQLLQKAEEADSTPLEDGRTGPAEVARRQPRMEKRREATAALEARAKERHREEMAVFAEKQKRRDAPQAAGKKPRGRAPQPPRAGPRAKDQDNFTDPESRIMKSGAGFAQSDNAQAAVEIESRLLVSHAVTDAPNDKEQLAPTLAATSPVIERIAAVLVDSGFYSAAAISAVESGRDGRPGPAVYAATGRQPHGRRIEALEKRADPPAPEPTASAAAGRAHRLSTKAGRALYALRKQTIEPVFGIIKAALGFGRFSLRGLGNVRSEWTLVTLAYHLKRLSHLGARLQPA